MMRSLAHLVVSLTLLSFIGGATGALAQDTPAPEQELGTESGQGLPPEFSERPLVLPEGTLRVDVQLAFAHVDLGFFEDTFVSFFAGAGIGILENLEAGILALPLLLEPDFEYLDASLYGQYRFFERDDLEVAARLDIQLPTNSDFVLGVGVPVIYRPSEHMRIDSGFHLSFVLDNDSGGFGFSDSGDVALVSGGIAPISSQGIAAPTSSRGIAGIPFLFSYNVNEALFVGGRTGFGVGNFSEFGDTVFVPVGAHVGYTIADSGRPLADVVGMLRFPFLINSFPGDNFLTERWELRFEGNLYFDVY